MRKPELVEAVVAAARLSPRQADDALSALVENLTNALSRGETVNLVGFGSFSVRHQPERTGRHPQTGAPLAISAGNRVSFKPGKALRAQVNQRNHYTESS